MADNEAIQARPALDHGLAAQRPLLAKAVMLLHQRIAEIEARLGQICEEAVAAAKSDSINLVAGELAKHPELIAAVTEGIKNALVPAASQTEANVEAELELKKIYGLAPDSETVDGDPATDKAGETPELPGATGEGETKSEH